MSESSSPQGDIGSAIASWNGKAVLSRYVREAEAWIFLALHDDRLGPCTGGTRIMVYETPAHGVIDAMRLAEGMTHKWAILRQEFGGGKGVLALSRPLAEDERLALLGTYGSIIASLRGAFSTGEDLGTSPSDMVHLRRFTRFVHGFDPEGRKWDPSPYTARGVFSAIQAGLASVSDASTLNGKRVVVQGVGNVGTELVRLLLEAGATVAISDVSDRRVSELRESLPVSVLDPDEVLTSPCDVLAPCAVGGVLDETTIPQLQCSLVAGAANNQLAASSDAVSLHERGILYLPDYVVNGGGALAFSLMGSGVVDQGILTARVDGIGATITTILDSSKVNKTTPLESARKLVESRLEAAVRA